MDYPRSYGPYTLLERLGRGGMSDVDLARQSVESASYVRFVVIKRLRTEMTANPDYVRMFQDEARINAELQHANIAQVYSFGQTDGEYFLAMEYIAGADLREAQKALLRSGRRVPTRIALRIIVDVLSALSYAHGRVDTYGRPMCIVHRDVNPRNIMLSARGEVKLIDFGVAKAANRAEQTIRHTFKGKFAYMAPEQLQEDMAVDHRADLYAMGLVLHELINNSSPFAGLGDIQIMQRILTGRIQALTDPPDFEAPDALREIHQRSLKLDPEERYSSADEMRAAVIDAAASSGGIAEDAELIEFLRELLPDAAALRQEKLQVWREAPPSPVQGNPLAAVDDATISILAEGRHALRPVMLGAGLGLLVLMVLALVLWPAPPPEPTPAAVAPSDGSLQAPEAIEDEAVMTSTPAPVEPLEEPAKPMRRVQRPSDPAPSPSAASDLSEADGTGRISIPAFPDRGLNIRVDGRTVGQTPMRLLEVAAGIHSVEVIDPNGEGWVTTIEVVDGDSKMVEPPR